MKSWIQERAKALGFDKVGVCSATLDGIHKTALSAWVGRGYAGEMDYMVRDWQRRADPSLVLPGAKSLMALATNYYHPENPPPQDRGRLGRVARYAYGRDYHNVIGKGLKKLIAAIRERAPMARLKGYVDTGPVLERAVAAQAGLGFIGKNTTLITEDYGSWVFLSVILTDLELEPDQPLGLDCGNCTVCLKACPTGAIVEPTVIDSRRCISYLTIEYRGDEIPAELARQSGDWVYGCDICQEVCPYNRATTPSRPEFHPSQGVGAWLPLDDLEKGAVSLAGTPLKRAGLKGLARNARAVADHSP